VAEPALDEQLAALGCEKFDETHVQLCGLNANFIEDNTDINRIIDYSILYQSSPEAIGSVVKKLRGDSDAEIAALIARWQSMPLTLRSYVAMSDNAPAAHVLTIEDDGCIGVFDIITHARHRGRGLATWLLSQALRNGFHAGARVAYLQVVETNPARRVYERLGFRTAYTYWYRQLSES
jgi:N-acetylglutamate synthase